MPAPNRNTNKLVNRTVEQKSYNHQTGAISSATSYSMVTGETDQFSMVSQIGNMKAPTPQSLSKTSTSYFNGFRTNRIYNGQSWTETSTSGPQGSLSPFLQPLDRSMATNCFNAALSDLYDQVRGSIDLSIDIAQAGQTRGLLRSMDQLTRYVMGFRKSHLKRAFADWQRAPKKLGGRWLEFQYGMKPTMQTAFDCIEQIFSDVPKRLKVKARSHDQRVDNFTITEAENMISHGTCTNETRVEIGIQLKIADSTAETLGRYTSLNPASIAWELTPYSFVVDWFVDVGGYIRNLESACLYSTAFVSGYRTTGHKLKQDWNLVQNFSQAGVKSLSASMNCSRTQTEKVRVPYNTIPLPKPPHFNAVLGSGRLLNAAALLSQHMR